MGRFPAEAGSLVRALYKRVPMWDRELRALAPVSATKTARNVACPTPTASPRRLADVHSARLGFFVLSRSGRPRRAAYANTSRSETDARRHIRRNRSGRVRSWLRQEGASSASMA
jgi:hypothetical protein